MNVAEFLLKQCAPLGICTAAMLGIRDYIVRRLDADPRNANAIGAHGIPLLPHAAWNIDLGLVQLVFERDAKSGANLALHNAVSRDNYEIVEWLADNEGPDIRAKNFQGKTPLTVANERNNDKIATFLKKPRRGGLSPRRTNRMS